MGMGKRNTIYLVSSSDDEEKAEFSLKSQPKASSLPRISNPKKRAKKAPLSNSCSRPRRQSEFNDFAEIKRFCQEFDEGIRGFKVSTGHGMSTNLWVDKYKPNCLEELAVHKKKVEEVKALLEERFITSEQRFNNNVILFSGPTGVGKSATIYALASHFKATICEWNTPTPTIWQEHLHNSSSGLRYTSKLDEFETFVDKIRKYGCISSSASGGSRVILLIDDLPIINGKVAYGRLRRCLHLLVQSVTVPTVILFNDYGNTEATEYSMRYWEELQLFLQESGACKVAFNPITTNSLKKTLLRISREEQCEVSAEELELIAKASGGDIRHAITSLQYYFLRPNEASFLSFTNSTPPRLNQSQDEITHLSNGHLLPFGRDDTLSLFHALGKFLHNKRDSEKSMASDSDPFILKENFRRLPLKMDAPELILRQAYGQSRPVADFLHENVLDFISEEAMDDAWIVASYLSDADFLLASLSGKLSRNYEAENVVQSAAASVAVRGVLFGNSHLAPSRWHSIRRPKLWQVEQSLWHNKSRMVSQRHEAYCGMNLVDPSVIATEFQPTMKWIGYRAPVDHNGEKASPDCMDLDENVLANENCITSEDEIEDW
ncbi:OLC1v1011077C1 [Oldenlandia corymbosa var. corymbosa]|uniref:OLC1v1011077C1 n=1 Tax=Oldenlandia corymbosa var. corymbosa TaxID=529605 RepID=A0AAV1DSR4_OLDCO|nr:OLC1v1011077C1 [Oldenlandia corymbosa var. corymbosa]